MITLFHGDYIEASRNELARVKATVANKDIREVEGRTLDTQALTQALESQSLFGGDTVVFIYGLLKALGRKTKQAEAFTAILTGATGDIYLWEDKEIAPTLLKQLGPKAAIRLFKLPTIIFQFLDGIAPGNAKKMLALYDELIALDAPELVHSMLAKRVRQLLMLADGTAPAGLAPWQASRLTTQGRSFSIKKLRELYQELATMEFSIKSGATPFTLAQLTRQMLINL